MTTSSISSVWVSLPDLGHAPDGTQTPQASPADQPGPDLLYDLLLSEDRFRDLFADLAEQPTPDTAGTWDAFLPPPEPETRLDAPDPGVLPPRTIVWTPDDEAEAERTQPLPATATGGMRVREPATT